MVAFDVDSLQYELKWDDGDKSHTSQPFSHGAKGACVLGPRERGELTRTLLRGAVHLNKTPDADAVGVNTNVIYMAGTYTFGGKQQIKYLAGQVVEIIRGTNVENKYVVRDEFSPESKTTVTLDDLRVPGNAMAAIAAQMDTFNA